MKLLEAYEGLWVLFKPKGQVGRVKKHDDKCIFVVFFCDNDWDNFANYTAAATDPDDLHVLNGS
jgi:hypothetical protein